MWEHAFYLQYKNVKGDYFKAFWNIANWADVATRFESVRGVNLCLQARALVTSWTECQLAIQRPRPPCDQHGSRGLSNL